MTDIIVIIDESSSMDCMGNEPKDATNNFINEQITLPRDPSM